MKTIFSGRYTKGLIITGLLCTLVIIATPFLLNYLLTDWLKKNGAHSAQIESLLINPFLGKFSIKGLDVAGQEKELARHADLVVDIGLGALFDRKLKIENAEYSGLYLDVEQTDDGDWRFGSFTVAAAEQAEVVPETGTARPWYVDAENIVLTDCRVVLTTPQLELDIYIESATLTRFSTEAGEPAGVLVLSGSVNDSPVAVTLEQLQITPHVDIKGRLSVERFDLTTIGTILETAFSESQAVVSAAGKILFATGPKKNVSVQYDGDLTLTQSGFGNRTFSTTADSLSWQGAVRYQAQKSQPATIGAEGLLSTNAFSLSIPAQELEFQQEFLSLQTKTDVTLTPKLAIVSSNTLKSVNLALQLPLYDLKQEQLQWQGDLQLNQTPSLSYTVTGDVDLGPLQLQVAQQGGSVEFASLALQQFTINDNGGKAQAIATTGLNLLLAGKMPLDIRLKTISLADFVTSDFKEYQVENISLEELQATSSRSGERLAGFSSLTLADVATSTSPAFGADKVMLENLQFLGQTDDDGLFRLNNGTSERVRWSVDQGTAAESLVLDGLDGSIVRFADGAININEHIAAMIEPETPGTESNNQQEQAQGANLRIGEIVISGKSALTFEDKTLKVPYTTSLDIDSLKIQGLDSTKAEKQLNLDFHGSLEKRAPLKIAGDLSPFLKQPEIQLSLNVKNYPLKSLSPYTIQAVGTALDGGRLRLNSSIELQSSQLDLKNTLRFEDLTTTTVSKELARELDNQLPVPLDSALAMLRDGDGNIELKIPIQGPLEELEVGIGDIVVTALSKSIVTATSSYFLYALGPYGALAYVGMKMGEGILSVNLPPLEFTPGEAVIQDQQHDYLNRLATILQERPETDLQLVPRVTGKDLYPPETTSNEGSKQPPSEQVIDDTRREQLLDLGQQRAAAFQRYLVQTLDIDKARLLVSPTSLELQSTENPMVVIELK